MVKLVNKFGEGKAITIAAHWLKEIPGEDKGKHVYPAAVDTTALKPDCWLIADWLAIHIQISSMNCGWFSDKLPRSTPAAGRKSAKPALWSLAYCFRHNLNVWRLKCCYAGAAANNDQQFYSIRKNDTALRTFYAVWSRRRLPGHRKA